MDSCSKHWVGVLLKKNLKIASKHLSLNTYKHKHIFLVAFCQVPTLSQGSISTLGNCPSGTCDIGTRVTFSCETGYALSGSSQSHCTGYDRWDPPVPTCEGKSESFTLG